MKLPMNLIYCTASDFKLDARMVAAICSVESGGGAYKTRFEATLNHNEEVFNYTSKYKYVDKVDTYAAVNGITAVTEACHQQTSWGLLQIMGGTARWLGYQGDLPELVRPSVNLYWGCVYLKRLSDRYNGNMLDVVAAYNAGSARKKDGKYVNQGYVDKVMARYKDMEVSKPNGPIS